MSAVVLHEICKSRTKSVRPPGCAPQQSCRFLSYTDPAVQMRSRYTRGNVPMTSSRAKPLVRALAFTTVADSAPGMMWLAEPHGGRTFFNTTWLTFTGRTVAEESGVGWAL